MSDQFDNSGANGGTPPPPFGSAPSGPAGAPGQSFLPPPTQPVYSNPPGSPVYTDPNAPHVTDLVEGSNQPRRSRGKMVGALVAVAALLGAGAFAITKIGDDDAAAGGAASPQEVGDKLVESLNGEDLLGIVDLLLPGERETFRQPLLDLNTELKRLEVTDGSVDLNKVPGLDINIADPRVRAHDTNVDDISTVNITGTASVAVNGKDLPIGNLLIDTAFGGERPDVDADEDEEDFDVTVTTVKDGGHWYLSLLYSAANSLANGQDVPEEGVQPVGADSPEGALGNLIAGAGDLNLEKIIAGLNPNEAASLQRYAPLFLDDAQNELDKLDADIEIKDAQYAVTGSGNRRQVTITAININATVDGEEVSFELKDGCATVTSRGQSIASCSGEESDDGALGTATDQLGLPDTPELKTFFDDLGNAFSDLELHGIVVDKVDGKWFVSPLGTGAEVVLSILRALDRDEIETLINSGQAAFDSVIDAIFADFPDTDPFPPDTTYTDDTTYDTTYTTDDTTYTTDDSTDDTATDDTATDDTATDDTATDNTGTDDTINIDTTTYYFDCLYGLTGDDAAACVQKGLDDGRFSRDEVPGPYQFPDCGLFDYYNGTDIYSDSPEEFQNVIEPKLQCIVDAAASAGADISYSSPEFAHPECFVGVNPYNYSGDTDAISEAYDCAYAGS